jgi:hypothetical protein
MVFVTSFTIALRYKASRSANWQGFCWFSHSRPNGGGRNGASDMCDMRNIFLAVAMMAAIPSTAVAQQAVAPAAAAAQPAAPSASGGGIQIPEPGDLALFLIGVAGLIVGRWTARSRKRNQE